MQLIASTATMLPGFSGGPLLDASGNVIGLLSSHLGRGQTLSIPVATVERVATALRTHGRVRKGTIGVIAQGVQLTGDLADLAGSRGGLLVNGLIADGPAAAAGVAAGDLLVGIDDLDLATFGNLREALRDDRIGEVVTLRIVRGGEIVELPATVAERPRRTNTDADAGTDTGTDA